MKLKLQSCCTVLLLTLLYSTILHSEPVWVDVRTSLEHSFDNIEGDIRVSHSKILQEANTLFPDKNAEIRLYCRSGRRSGLALSALKEAGYTNVINAGSIDDARRERGISD